MSKLAIDGAKRGPTTFLVDPTELVIRTEADSATFDPRANLAVDDGLVLSMMRRGWLNAKPAIVRKDGNKLEVIDGRQRTKAAVEANKRRSADGLEPIQARVVLEKGASDSDIAALMIVANTARPDTPLELADKTRRLYQLLGSDEAQTAEALHVSTATVRNRLRVFDCHPSVQKAVESHEITLTDAIKTLAKLPRDEQVKALADMRSNGVSARTAGESRGAPARKARKGLGRGDIKRLLVEKPSAFNKRETLLLQWIVGTASKGDVGKSFPELV